MDQTLLTKIALAGNPNSGKTSLFNLLTGSNQKVGNYPGVTVTRRTGRFKLAGRDLQLVDLPGTYSLYPNSLDERIACEVLLQPDHDDYPDLVLYVADANQLDRQLLFFSQIQDLGFPIVLVVSLIDTFEKAGHQVDLEKLAREFDVPVFAINSKSSSSLQPFLTFLEEKLSSRDPTKQNFYEIPAVYEPLLLEVAQSNDRGASDYLDWVTLHHKDWLDLPVQQKEKLDQAANTHSFEPLKAQIEETLSRLQVLEPLAAKVIKRNPKSLSFSQRIDDVVTHTVWGPLIFVLLMLLVFQAIFAWATYPMDAIESSFAFLGNMLSDVLPNGWFAGLITEGVLPGLSGVLIFVPQIAILFFLIAILEETGYMARAVYLFDHLLQRFGMNGRSIVALISGGACAIPAIMTTRTISNWKERLITIMVTPFISCSARIPVYTLLIAFVVPYKTVAGVFNTQGLAFAGLYVLSIVTALVAGWIFKKILKSNTPSMLALEMPPYVWPDWRNVWSTIKSRVGAFIFEAGKIILLISMVLWFLASYGPSSAMQEAEESVSTMELQGQIGGQEAKELLAARRLEASYAGHLGKFIEPVIQPLGYDWKMGIGIIAAFAAREVFVGTLATIYSVGSEEDEFRIRSHLASQRDPETGAAVFNPATAMSLLLFFVFAMQCMSTLAIVKEETKSWKWPIIQFLLMTGLAYLVSLVVYQAMAS